MIHTGVRNVANWIAGTPLSNWFQTHAWVVPTSQSFHIVSVGVVFASALLISLRLLGVGRSGRSVSQLAATLTPWMYRALGVLVITGAIQTIAEPVRQFVTPAFWVKMGMIVCAVALTTWFAWVVRRHAAAWDAPAQPPVSGKMFAVVSLLLWIGIIFCGRFIGYTWNFYV